MNDMNPCGNHEALIAYLYDECEPPERESIAAHVALCASCAEEIQSLRDTRAHLGAWSPPSMALGFQITRTEADQPATSVAAAAAAWWRQPLPAWAQVAAAVVIFAAGMGVSAVRSTDSTTPAGDGDSEWRSRRTIRSRRRRSRATSLRVSTRAFVPLRARRRWRASVQLARTPAAAVNEQELLERVQALVDARSP